MKRISVIALLGLFAGMCGAQSSITIYGVVDTAATATNVTQGATTPGGPTRTAVPKAHSYRLDSGVGPAGRLGFRGTEDLGDGLAANFVLEMGIAADTGSLQQGGLAFGRQSYVGLSSKQGWAVSVGRQYSPQDIAFASVDALGGTYWGNITNNAGHSLIESLAAVPGGGAFSSPARVDNSVLGTYGAGPWTGKLMLAAGNENTRGTGRLWNAAVAYAKPTFQIQGSYVRLRQNAEAITASANPQWLTEWVVGGSVDLGLAKLYTGVFGFDGPKDRSTLSPAALASPFGFAWQRTRSVWLGAVAPVTSTSRVSAQIARVGYHYADGSNGRGIVVGLVYEYFLSKRTALYANYGMTNNNDRANGPLVATIPVLTSNGYGSDLRALSLGLRHTF